MFGFPIDPFGVPYTAQNRQNPNNALIPHQSNLFGHPMMMPSPFGAMSQLFNDFGFNSSPFAMMDRMMREAQQSTNNPVQSFTSTTVLSYNGGDGRPKIYQESSSTRRGPDGIEETRQTVRDSERGIKKVQIGHRIGDRKHVVEREMNTQTGQISENVELENLDEQETDNFQREWRQRATRMGHVFHPQPKVPAQLTSHRSQSHSAGSQRPQLAIEHHPIVEPSHREQSKSSRGSRHAPDRLTHRSAQTIDPVYQRRTVDREHPAAPHKRKTSSSTLFTDNPHDRKHRQHRF